jgi:glycolate oxidase
MLLEPSDIAPSELSSVGVHPVVSQLRAALGESVVSTDAATLDAARGDKSGRVSAGRPLAVVSATSIEHVQTVMRIATETRTPVVTRGAGTGLAGGAIATDGEIVLSTVQMNRVLEVAPDDELAVVEPGVINGDLNAHLKPLGLWFAPDPASRAISTIGGNIATNAGGLLCVKYGVTREAVLALKVVRADGSLLELGHRTIKGVTGLDLTALMIGSEGVLGVIVEATVRLRRIDASPVSTIGAHFSTVEQAARAASVISSSGITPSLMEVMDSNSISAIATHLGLDIRTDPYLLVQTDGVSAGAEAQAVVGVIRSLGGDAEVSTSHEEAERLLGIRRSFHPAMEARGRVLIEDVCVPRSALPAMFASIEQISARHGVEIATIAHAGDGNLHPNFVFEPDESIDGGVPESVWAAADDMFVTALRLGGTLTGEHGVGILKRRWLGQELGEAQVELQKQIKAVFDPLGILNPGKIF